MATMIYGLQCAQKILPAILGRFCAAQSTNSCLSSEQTLIWVWPVNGSGSSEPAFCSELQQPTLMNLAAFVAGGSVRV
jgi:hypothetical protein